MIKTGRYDIVIPTVGRPSLARLLDALVEIGAKPQRLTVVFDRPDDPRLPVVHSLVGEAAWQLGVPFDVLEGAGKGPAAARNLGWKAGCAEWVEFLDDDVVPSQHWAETLELDLASTSERVAGVDGHISVPIFGSVPTDWERNVRALEGAVWATADMAYRRSALAEVGGFDERFPYAYREDADLAMRVASQGYRLARGSRQVTHPVGPADWWVSVRLQRNNYCDALMRAVHGPWWRSKARVPTGRRPLHVATVVAAALTMLFLLRGQWLLAAAPAFAWYGLALDFAWRRIDPGPRTGAEVARMITTSLVIPFAAVYHWLRGWVAVGVARANMGSVPAWDPKLAAEFGSWPAPLGVLFDRDGTLVRDVPYNGDPDLVEPLPGAIEAVAAARRAGLKIGVISNQSAVGRGFISKADMRAVNRRIEDLFGPFDGWFVCTHAPNVGCSCRKPAPGLVLKASRIWQLPPEAVAVIGDIGSDVEAALAARAHPVLVPNEATLPAEIGSAPHTAPDLATAVAQLVGGRV